jgi:hypothetical protein
MPTRLRRLAPPIAIALTLAFALPFGLTGCFRGGGRLLGAMAFTALVTAAVVSSQEPPPPRVVYVEAPRPGYTYQPGYWTLDDREWIWVDGTWHRDYQGYRFRPAHWVADRGGHWHLVPGDWVPDGSP